MPLLDLGDINFGLGAETKALQKAVQSLRDFGKVVNQTARDQTSGASKAVSALNRQERAIRAALQSVLNLNAEIRRVGADPGLLARNTQAFQKLSRTFTQGEVDIVSFTRAQDRFRAQLNKSHRGLRSFKADQATKSVGRFNQVIRDLESASVLAVGPLSGLGARVRALGAITSRSTLAIAAFLGGITAVIVGIAKLTSGAVSATRTIDKIEKALLVATGSAFAARQEFQFISDVAQEFGIDIATAGEQFSKFAAAAKDTIIEGKAVREVFRGVAAAASALGLGAGEVEGIFRALQQIISKGVVQAEELRGQFGERLVGGFALAARAFGVTTSRLSEMIEKGEVGIDLVAKLGGELTKQFQDKGRKAATAFQGTINNLNNAILLFNKALDESTSLSQIFLGAIRTLTAVIKSLTPIVDDLVAAFEALAVAALAAVAPTIIRGFILLAGALRAGAVAAAAFTIALATNPLVALASVFGRVVLAVTAGTAAFLAFRNAGDDVIETTDALIESGQDFIDTANLMGGASKEFTDILIADTEKQIKAIEARLKVLNETVQTIRDAGGIEIFGVDVGEFWLKGEGAEQVTELSTRLERLNQILEDLSTIGEKAAAGQNELSKIGQDLKDDIDDLILDFKALHREEEALASGGGLLALQHARDMNEVVKALGDISKLTAGDIEQLRTGLMQAGFGGATLEEQVLNLIRSIRQMEEVIDNSEESLEELEDAFVDASQSIEDLRKELEALGRGGPEAVKKLKRQLSDRDDLIKFKEALEDAGVSASDIARLGEEFSILQFELREAEQRFEDLEPVIGAVEKALGSAKDGLKDLITGAKSGLEVLRDVALSVIDSILDALLEILIIRPAIEQFLGGIGGGGGGRLFGALGGLFSGLLGGIGGGFAPTPTGAANPRAIGLQGGGRFGAGDLIKVGEGGPELLAARAPGQVFTGNELGGEFVFIQQINISPGVPEAVRREINLLRPVLRRDAIDALQTFQTRRK